MKPEIQTKCSACGGALSGRQISKAGRFCSRKCHNGTQTASGTRARLAKERSTPAAVAERERKLQATLDATRQRGADAFMRGLTARW